MGLVSYAPLSYQNTAHDHYCGPDAVKHDRGSPRRNRKRASRLLLEHRRRIGDPNTGGMNRRPIMTAYRQEAERCLVHLAAGPTPLRTLRAAGDVPKAAAILRDDVYGWFERVERGVYRLTPKGEQALGEVAR